MKGQLATYPYGGVRARALATRLLSPPELFDLAGSDSRDRAVAEIERRLSLSNGDLSIDHRLHADYLNFALIILPTLPEEARDLFKIYLERQCLENIFLLCRSVLGESNAFRYPDLLPTMRGHFPLPEPDGVHGLEDIAASLPDSRYREIVLDSSHGSTEQRLTRLENRLIHTWWNAVAFHADRLPSADREAARDILGKRADIDALRIVRRGLEIGRDTDRILDLWPNLAGLLDLDRLQRVLRSPRPPEGLDFLLQRVLGKDFEENGYEMALRWRLHRHLRRRLLEAPFGISVPLSALLLKELEVMDLQGLLGGLRFELDQDTLRSFVAGRKG